MILPDHFHCILSLPKDDKDYPLRIRLIKTYYFKRIEGRKIENDGSRSNKKEKTIWQRRYWEHFIKDDEDYAKHIDYIHYNPVKHGLAQAPKDWEYSSFLRFVSKGVYEPD